MISKLRKIVFSAVKHIALTIRPIRRLIQQRDQLLAQVSQLKADDDRSSAQILDAYTAESPSTANSFCIFAGEWSSAVPGFETGKASLFDDSRIKWLEQQSGGFSGKRILELGPLEGGHTYMMERAGATVVAIESNQRAFLKCLIVKEALGLNAKFLYGDVRPYLKTCNGQFDFVLASGVLYHMMQPAELLRDMSRVANSLGIWTHYYDEAIIRSRADLREKFDPDPFMQNVGGRDITFFRQHYRSVLAWPGFCGGSEPTSCWFTKDGLLNYLQDLDLNVSIGEDNPDHPNGPCILLFARRRNTAERLT
jgi:SAM-dependent methyltransferase